MSRNNPSLLQILAFLPWWVSIITGLVVFIALFFVFPALAGENQILIMVTLAAKKYALLFACLFLIPAVSSIFKRRNQINLKNEHQHNCPKCSSPLVKRKARRGRNAGNEFFGCSGFPHCRYIENKV